MKKIFTHENIVTFILVYLACGIALVTFSGIWMKLKSKIAPATTTTTTTGSGT